MKIKKLPIKFYRMYVDGKNLFVAENDSMNIFSYNESLSGLLKDLNEEFNMIWKMYVMEKDDKLTDRAIEFKHKLIEYNLHDNINRKSEKDSNN